jgi:hypothetical protein
MKPASFVTALLLAIVCVVLSVALVITARTNQRLQAELQTKQQLLNSGILGAQGQQIGNSLLQDMASTAARSAGMRKLLQKHGYQVQAPAGAEAATNATEAGAADAAGGAVEKESAKGSGDSK